MRPLGLLPPSRPVQEVGSFQHQQPGLLDLYAGLGNVGQDRALLYQGLREGHSGLRLRTQETGREAQGCALQRR